MSVKGDKKYVTQVRMWEKRVAAAKKLLDAAESGLQVARRHMGSFRVSESRRLREERERKSKK